MIKRFTTLESPVGPERPYTWGFHGPEDSSFVMRGSGIGSGYGYGLGAGKVTWNLPDGSGDAANHD